MLISFPCFNFACSGLDRYRFFLGQETHVLVDLRRCRLDQAQGTDEFSRHRHAADGKILHSTLGLGAPKRICGNLQFTHAVVFSSVFGHR